MNIYIYQFDIIFTFKVYKYKLILLHLWTFKTLINFIKNDLNIINIDVNNIFKNDFYIHNSIGARKILYWKNE